jgi:carboxyl-terminal processing protease
MRTITVTTILLFFLNTAFGQSKFQKDFLFYWQTINDNFAYFNKQKTNWEKVKTIYEPLVDTLRTKNDFVHLLETANNELYNGHIFLNTNTKSSNRTIPTGADLKATWTDNKFVITEIREGFNADICGLKTGMIITKFNNIPIDEAIKKFLPKSVSKLNKEMYEYAVNMLLAGTHNTKREITITEKGKEQKFEPDNISNKTEDNYNTLLKTEIMSNNIGYIKINNSLGNSDLIKAFDTALDSLINTNGLILDLRETPSGGSTTIARAIMGRFIDKELPYQKHIYTSEEKETGIKRTTLELVSPRQNIYKKPVVVLVGNWTGSMGEGIAIGFDGMKRAKIVGTKMAGLLGEIYSFETPETKIPFSFPCVQLQHINGQAREDFMPTILVTDQNQTTKTAIKLLTTGNKNYR